MALPVHSTSLPPDTASSGWAAITVRVAWALVSQNIKIKPGILRDARDHVLYHLEPNCPLDRAEDLASLVTVQLVRRARRQPAPVRFMRDLDMPLSLRWLETLTSAFTQVSQVIFHQHYGDGMDLASLEALTGIDRTTLQAARAGIREVLRAVALRDGLPLHDWSALRLDQLLARFAGYAPGDCPPLHEVAEGCHGAHARRCVRCDRTVRLVRAGVLAPDDLVAPALATRPSGRVRLLALHFHPAGRVHREAIARETGVAWCPIGQDTLLIDGDKQDIIAHTLRMATELSAPHRDHLRGVVIEGPGRWSSYGLLGPLANQALTQLRSVLWGQVNPLGQLPEPLPKRSPTTTRWWLVAAAVLMALVGSTAYALQPAKPPAAFPIQASFGTGRGGVWTWFDVDELAHLALVRETGGRLDVVVSAASPANKMALATQDGSYRVHTMGEGVLLVSSAKPMPQLADWVNNSGQDPHPLASLARTIRWHVPSADVGVYE